MSTATPISPREVFERFQRRVLANSWGLADLHADDVVVEWPFNPPSRPRRIQGREQVNAIATAAPALPVRFEEFRNVVVHETSDPEVIIAEYEMVGTVTTTGRRASAAFVMVLQVRDGQVVLCREYQNVLAMAAALGQLPALIADYNTPENAPEPA